MLRVAINGFGRIGRVALRLLQDEKNVQVVAINNRTPGNEQLAYLYRYDSSHRTLKSKISFNEVNNYTPFQNNQINHLIINTLIIQNRYRNYIQNG